MILNKTKLTKQYTTRSIIKKKVCEINKKTFYNNLLKKHNINECKVILIKLKDR